MSTGDHFTADSRGLILSCPRCQRPNRIPFQRLREAAHCGICKGSLPLPASPVSIDSLDTFSALVRSASLPVFIDFWAPWCGPCKVVAPEVGKLAGMTAGELLVAKVNTQEQPEIANAMNIRSIPTFAVFATGRELDRMSGAVSAQELRAFAVRATSGRKAGP
jgi:thioredoxin 2